MSFAPWGDEQVPWDYDSSDEEKEEEEFIQMNQNEIQAFRALPPNPSLKNLYSYMLDSNFMIFDKEAYLLDNYSNVHNYFIDFLKKQNFESSYLPGYYLKAYFKFRHNVFATLFKLLVFGGEHGFETDVSLEQFCDSKKTPDFIFENEEFIFIIEFTVGNDYDRILFIKGGGMDDVKYHDEALKVEEIKNKKCRVLIVPAVLKNYNIQELEDIALKFFGKSIDKYFLELFFNIASKDLNILGENMSIASNNFKDKFLVPNFPKFDFYPRPQLGTVFSLSSEFVCNYYNKLDYLRNSCLRYTEKPKKFFVSICYEIESKNFTIRNINKSKLKPLEVFDLLNNKSIGELLPYMNVFKNNQIVSIENIRGTMPIMIAKSKEIKPHNTINYRETITNFYFNTKSIYEDDYGTPQEFDENDIIKQDNWGQVIFPPDYYNSLLNVDHKVLKNMDVDRKMLANNEMNMDQLAKSIEDFKSEMEICNNIDFQTNPKQSFQFPLVSWPVTNVKFDDINFNMIEMYSSKSNCIYTKAILQKVLLKTYSQVTSYDQTSDVKKFRDKLSDQNKEYFSKMLSLTGNKPQKFSLLPVDIRKELRVSKQNIEITQRNYRSALSAMPKTIRERMVKINCSKKSSIYPSWKNEMIHFAKTGSNYRGVGRSDFDTLTQADQYFNDLSQRFFEPDFTILNTRKLFNEERGPGPDFLTKEKNKFTDNWKQFMEKLKGTLFDQQTEFVSRLCHSLFKESTRTYNKSYIKVENLGLNDIIVLIRGGSKLYKNQTSKLFKVFFYIDPKDLKFTGYGENQHFEVFRSGQDDRFMIVTPWMQLHQDVLLDGISCRHRSFMNLYTNQKRSNKTLNDDISKFNSLPMFLFFHNRRKTETFMHNCRYLIVNILGRYANLRSIVKSFATFNYTYFDAWLKFRIEHNYLKFAEKFIKFKSSNRTNIDLLLSEFELNDLWFNEPIINSDHLTSFIYSSYMMTKAPIVSSVEQAGNLWEILEDVRLFDENHSDVEGLDDVSLRFDCRDPKSEVYLDDFKYDPVFCQYLGFYTASFLNKSIGKSKIYSQWINLSSQPIDRIANSKGLRGWNKDNFFNKKSYEIVYENVIDVIENKNIDIKQLVDNYLSAPNISTGAMMVKSDIEQNYDSENSLNELVFHVVQKIQRGGSREIFCMDMNTKIKQNPLEKFFKFLCKSMPNEFISVPSNKRAGMIHTDFFEKGPGAWVKNIVRWVLDCRRWAPHSVFQKYVHFIYGMAPLLPVDFLNKFNKFSEGMFNKRFYTRDHVLNKMRNNQRFVPYTQYIKKDDNTNDGYYFHVKFSFVMGIFNYLSSLMHSGNQLLASELIRDYGLKNDLGLIHLETKCHSDDSVVSSHHESDKSIEASVFLYDWWLKSANHMLSVKKSQVNDNVYLEFLSTLYLFDRLLPVLPKFSSSLPFQPSDSGYSSDITFSVTQSIEMISQGGSFEESFLMLKLSENFIQGLYNINPNINVPFHFLGGIDSHPIELLLSGSDCELFKHLKYNRAKFLKYVKLLAESKIININDIGSFSLNWDMGSRANPKLLKKFSKWKELAAEVEEKGPWTFSNSKLGNQYLNVLWFINKLSDPKYYSALVNEPSARRYSRIFGAFNHRTIRNIEGQILDVTEISDKLLAIQSHIDEIEEVDFMNFEKVIDILNEELSDFYRCIEDVELISVIPNNFKDKPITFVSKDPFIGQSEINSSDYVVATKEPHMFKLLGKTKDLNRGKEMIDDRIRMLGLDPDKLDNNELFKLSNKILGKDNRTYRITACVGGENRYIDHYSQMIHLIATNSERHLKYNLKFKRANMVDWERRLIKGRIPSQVSNCMKHYWAIKCLTNFNVIDDDIYRAHPNDLFKKSLDEIPKEWALIIYSSLKDDDTPLIDKYYWSFWEKEQVKMGIYWYGAGSCIINIPEALIKIKILNGIVTDIDFENVKKTNFSIPSSWYLKSFFNQPGIFLEMFDKTLGDMDKMVMGYNSSNGLYGFGFPNNFDLIYLNCNENKSISLPFMKKRITPTRNRAHWVYKDYFDTHKIYFFTPEDDQIIVSLNEYIDKDKLKQVMFKPHIKDFCSKFAIDQGKHYFYKFSSLLDNISRSKIYKIFYNFSRARDVYESKKCLESDDFIDSLIEWKKYNTDFGFPEFEDLCLLLKQNDVPPLPLSVQRILFNLGKNEVDDAMLSTILYNSFNLQGEDKENYLANISSQYGGEMTVNMMVLSLKSKRIFSVCKWLGKDSFRVLIPVLTIIEDVLESESIFCLSLHMKCKELNNSKLITNVVTHKSLFHMMATRAILDSMTSSGFSKDVKSVCNVMLLIDEMVNSGLRSEFAMRANNDALLRSVDFSISDEDFLGWIIDLFDSVIAFGWRLPKSVILDDKKYFGERGLLRNDLSFIAASTLSIKMTPCEKRIYPQIIKRIRSKKKEINLNLMLTDKKTAGVVDQEFFPIDDETMEEYVDGMSFDPDIEEYTVVDKTKKVPDFAYIYMGALSKISLRSCRGTANNLIIRTNQIYKSMLDIHGSVRIFVKKTYSTLREFVNNPSDIIVFISKSKHTKMKLENYTELDTPSMLRFLSPGKYENDFLEIQGVKMTKVRAAKDPKYRWYVSTLESYFGQYSEKSLKEKMKDVKKVEKINSKEYVPYTDTFQSVKNRLDSEIKSHIEQEEHKESENLEEITEDFTPSVDLKEMIKNFNLNDINEIVKVDEIAKTGKVTSLERKIISNKPLTMKFKDSMNVFHDADTRAELETLFPGYMNLLLNKEIFLTARTKMKRIKMADLCIANMPQYMKEKYQRLLGVVKLVLTLVPETKLQSREDLKFANIIEDLFYIDDEYSSEEEIPFHLLHADDTKVELEFNLDYM